MKCFGIKACLQKMNQTKTSLKKMKALKQVKIHSILILVKRNLKMQYKLKQKRSMIVKKKKRLLTMRKRIRGNNSSLFSQSLNFIKRKKGNIAKILQMVMFGKVPESRKQFNLLHNQTKYWANVNMNSQWMETRRVNQSRDLKFRNLCLAPYNTQFLQM